MIGIIVGLIFLLIVFTLILSKYMIKRWEAEKELHLRHERILAEENNVRFCVNKYRREIQRAKEILGLGLVALKNDKVELNAKDVKNIVPASLFRFQNYNIYYLLGEVLKTVNNAESDLLSRTERANSRIADFNIYIKAPIFPRMVADQIGFNEEEYGSEEFEKLGQLLDQRIAQTDLLEQDINILLPENKSKKGLKKDK